ncbi:hypothetical protein B0T14DRAFT_495006 [Immersiella caudata]|uniref:Uncharacterized protein n=1 Tax=Immersiella caudata TaxID=314043 RepID=A0AA40C417_9PEZI|nr:hypothetical protein B0T14DRAFT_495006 [Immersiella caudata]
MASFFEDLYNKLFPPLSTSPPPFSTLHPSSFLLAQDDDMSTQNTKSLPPSTMDESAIVDSLIGGESVPGYFPTTPRTSMSSTISSQSDIANRLSTTAARPSIKHDAMTCHFPKPTEELNLDEMLAREPRKHTLGHWFKNGKEVRLPETTPAQQAKAFEDAKKELLRAKEEMLKLYIGKRA